MAASLKIGLKALRYNDVYILCTYSLLRAVSRTNSLVFRIYDINPKDAGGSCHGLGGSGGGLFGLRGGLSLGLVVRRSFLRLRGGRGVGRESARSTPKTGGRAARDVLQPPLPPPLLPVGRPVGGSLSTPVWNFPLLPPRLGTGKLT